MRRHRAIPGMQQHRAVEGLEQLLPILGAMQTKASRKVLRGALRAGLTVIRQVILQVIPSRSDGGKRQRLPETIGVSVGRDREHRIYAAVGFWKGAARKKKTKANWWVGVLAAGTNQPRRTKKTKANRGEIAQEDFVQRGYALSAHAAQGKIAAKARELIDKEILKARS